MSDSLAENTWSNVTDIGWTDGTGQIQFWKANEAIATGNSRTLSYACTGDAATGCILTVLEVIGSQRSVRQVSTASQNVASSTPAVSYPTPLDRINGEVGMIANLSSPAGLSSPGAGNEFADFGYSTPTTGLEVWAVGAGKAALSNTTWGGTSATSWKGMAMEIVAVPFDDYAIVTRDYQYR
jgi:hypothetical protein